MPDKIRMSHRSSTGQNMSTFVGLNEFWREDDEEPEFKSMSPKMVKTLFWTGFEEVTHDVPKNG